MNLGLGVVTRGPGIAWVLLFVGLATLTSGCGPEIDPVENARYEATGKARLRYQETQVYSMPGTPQTRTSGHVGGSGSTTYFTPVATAASVDVALADGVVTRTELDAATAAMLACLDEHDVEYTVPIYDESSHQYRFSMVANGGPQPGVTWYDECWMKYAQDVTGQWVRQNPPR